jgi:hypothetical protein
MLKIPLIFFCAHLFPTTVLKTLVDFSLPTLNPHNLNLSREWDDRERFPSSCGGSISRCKAVARVERVALRGRPRGSIFGRFLPQIR